MLTSDVHLDNKTINDLRMPRMGRRIANKNKKTTHNTKQIL